MNEAVQEIIRNLGDQSAIYTRMLELTRRQVDALERRDAIAVNEILQELELALLERALVERRRTRAIANAAVELGVTPDDVTASLLAERSAPDAAASIRHASGTLKAIVMDLDQVVDHHRALLDRELETIEFVVRGITTVKEPATYVSTGQQSQGTQRRLLDMQV